MSELYYHAVNYSTQHNDHTVTDSWQPATG